jgi:hypothetical protein
MLLVQIAGKIQAGGNTPASPAETTPALPGQAHAKRKAPAAQAGASKVML